ncbi:hypothetical protein PsAD2_01826 [Pseudovibrio axinellae]|uniref:Alpha-glutamyl/putrescinyl thymine pyrophosphorylase clade 3 domain-containing protein n=1 Tax=Pseudovibrio axinellae TaxID=989403 RepID=A0A165Z699_9HYPH|nr:hypothetical protein [Pseudovibrio axinellae]KZL19548.1 hypothetical protein PsAD2_01826 [Pseudovibrio axinellae]SEQ31457.1 hypothetical protein SAMN05421798_102387 [Pseudovibrio axinellae]
MAVGLHRQRFKEILENLERYENDHGRLLGLSSLARRKCLAEQMVSSIRRIEFVRQVLGRGVGPSRADPHSSMFDPIKGAIHLTRNGDYDGAVWLAFIQTHFGKHADDGWKLAANVYGSFGGGPVWDFSTYGANLGGFLEMLQKNTALLNQKSVAGRFSNHRKYQSKQPHRIAETFRTYYEWQTQAGGFRDLVQQIHKERGQHPAEAFDGLYKSMRGVAGFGQGRLGRFDFLTMLGKLDLAPIEPGSVYLDKATGPLAGARLLFFDNRDYNITGKVLQSRVDSLDAYLQTGKQVIEDSICNWQKSPERFVYFRG